MGEVHLAVASGLGGARKLVVVKRVLEGLADDPEFREMFLNEARLAATLDHPHIVRVYDVCEIDGRPSIVMEYVHGESLGSLLHLAMRGGTELPLVDALTIVDAVAGALSHAHDAEAIDGTPLGIVHRDVAPNNILVDYEGEVKLIDFGVARALGATRITRGSVVKGKAAYMAPEQYTGGEVDARSDVFALGVVLYEATTMRRAFKADNELATIARVVNGDLVPPTEVRPEYPRALERVVLGAVAAAPADRFPTAQALRDALADVARELGLVLSPQHLRETLVRLAGERPPPRVDLATVGMLRARRWGMRRAPVLAFAAGVIATGVAALTIGRDREPSTVERPESNEPTARCGDGTIDDDEVCDDGNERDGDGCNRDCLRSGSVLWEQTFQGNDPGQTRDDRGYRLAIDAHDEIVVVGEAAVPDARQNVFVRKYGANGEVRWTKQPGKAGDDEAWAVQILDDGGVVVGGYVFDDATGRDFWLAGFDADGRERWQFQRDAAEIAGRAVDPSRRSDDEIRGLVVTAPDRIVVVGKSFVDGAEDRFAAHGRVDASGLRLSAWDLASAEQPGGWDAVADVARTDSGFVLTGSRTRFARDGAKSLWVGWFDTHGAPLRELAIEPPGWPTPAGGEGNRLSSTNGTIHLAALLGGWGTEANAYYGALADGRVLWSREYDGPASLRDFAHGITVDREGNVIVVGEANGAPDRTGTGPDANAQVWITKLAPDLTELWSELYNGPENERDVAFDVATDGTNHIVVVGYQSVAGNGYDLWVRKYRP
jgi:cysteine-rich repeat protein